MGQNDQDCLDYQNVGDDQADQHCQDYTAQCTGSGSGIAMIVTAVGIAVVQHCRRRSRVYRGRGGGGGGGGGVVVAFGIVLDDVVVVTMQWQ